VHESYDTTVDYTEYGFFLNSKTLDIKTGSNVTSDTTKIDDEDYKITCVRGTTNTETNRALFTNTRNMTPDTGVSLDFLPYALILLAAVVGFGLLIFFKKKRAGR
jgi:LPXTG-motif cell wall-anchored protein